MELDSTLLDFLTSAQIADGYFHEPQSDSYRCLFCSTVFEAGIIYPIDDRLLTASKAASHHVEQAHGGAFGSLLGAGKAQSGISDTQAALLQLLFASHSDRRVAEALKISVSTVRNHRFQLRRRLREAKVFLAVMQLLETRKPHDQEFLKLPGGLTVNDERTQISIEQAAEVRKKYLETDPELRIRRFPKKEKLKLVLLLEVAKLFEPAKRYQEQEVNRLLRPVYDDYGTIRRYLVDYGLLNRTASGSEYWRDE